MQIKYSTKNDKEKSKKIWEEVFRDSQEFTNFYFDTLFDSKNLLLASKAGNYAGSLYENPYILYLNGEKILSKYIVGVAVKPEYRGEGVMRDLIATSLIENFHKGIPFFFLSPIDPTLYRKFGFEYCFDLNQYKIRIEDLKNFNKIYNLVRITSENLNLYREDLTLIYNSFMRGFSTYAIREAEYFTRYLKELESEDGKLYLVLKDGRGVGYISFFLQEKSINIRELFFKERDSLSTLLFLISSHINYFDDIEITAPVEKHLESYFQNQKKIQKNIIPFLMGRILDLEKIFNQYLNFKKIPDDLEFTFKVSDKIILENDGIWRVQNNKIEKVDLPNWDFEIGIGELAQLLLGYYSLQEMIELEKIKILCNDRVIKLLNYFLKSKNYIQEYV